MSYKSLLFCPDERTARTVTQVLRELEFAVEPANDPFSAVKKLTDERFDALVVDCQNEQDASLLFKTARDSSQNHSSLSVAVVEGQAGVAKAFRIGANLVLSKPINIEQSKGTLRVARGLLRKNEAKPAALASTRPVGEVSMFAQAAVRAASSPAAESARAQDSAVAASAKTEAPFSALEVESDPAPTAEAAEVAVLESLPEFAGSPTRRSLPSMLPTQAEPIAAGTSGQGAAVAPALAKDAAIELKTGSMPPMVTNEPIVAEGRFQEPFSSADVPAFSSLESTREGGAGKKFSKVAVTVLALGVAGYFGWQKVQPLQRLQRMRAARSVNTSVAVAPAPVATATPVQTPVSIQPVEKPEPPVAAESEISASAHTPPQNDDLETIEVQELPMSREAKPSAAPKAQPLIVKPDTEVKKNAKLAQLSPPPPVQVSSVNVSDSALTGLATTNAAIPKLAPTSVRVSQGVSQGLLLKKVSPVYPPMALQLHKEGAVELLTTINKQGLITNIKVLSGDSILAKPAVDAVRQWKYRPYLLNGEPVEIQTQITINFKAPR
jgi:TonB family protein